MQTNQHHIDISNYINIENCPFCRTTEEDCFFFLNYIITFLVILDPRNVAICDIFFIDFWFQNEINQTYDSNLGLIISVKNAEGDLITGIDHFFPMTKQEVSYIIYHRY